MAGGLPGLGSLQDYIGANQGLGPAAAIASDVPGIAGGLSSLLGGGAGLTDLLPMLGSFGGLGPLGLALGLASLGSTISNLVGSARSSTGPGSATSDIAQSGLASGDPVLNLLGMGASNLGGNIPVSSPSAGPGFGPYFDVARRLEDLLRWGPGGLTDPKAKALDATTLKNAMTEMGNPGSGNATIQALQNAFQTGGKYLTDQNLKLLSQGMNTQELNILQNILRGGGGGGGGGNGGGGGGQPRQPGQPQYPNPNPTPGLTLQQLLGMPSLMSLLGGGGGQGFYSGFRAV